MVVDVGTEGSSSKDPARGSPRSPPASRRRVRENAKVPMDHFHDENGGVPHMVRLPLQLRVDRWNEPAVICYIVAACVYTSRSTTDDAGRAAGRNPSSSPPLWGGESLLGYPTRIVRRSDDRRDPSRTSGGVYDRARKPPNHPVARNAVQIAALDRPRTRRPARRFDSTRDTAPRTSTSTTSRSGPRIRTRIPPG